MRLESALYASREGIASHGQAISVIGDNISNASTVGFKESRAEFSALMAEYGGDQRLGLTGSGSAVSTVRQIHQTGLIEFTGRSLDVGIAGNGFFLVGDASAPLYTRAGNFTIGTDGLLKTSDGLNVLGYSSDARDLQPIDMRDVSLNGAATTEVDLFGNVASNSPIVEPPQNPDSFNEVAAEAALTSTVEVYDSLGTVRTLSLAFYKTANNTVVARVYADGSSIEGGTARAPILLGETTLNFNELGVLDEQGAAAAQITLTPQFADGAAQSSITMSFANFTQFAGTSEVRSVEVDGQGVGAISEYLFQSDGTILAQLDSGNSVEVGRLPVALFVNNDGLIRVGQTRFASTVAAGDRTIALPGTEGTGELEGASLERSTVDIAKQFVDLVVYQRGYQASSQTLNAASQLIRETIQLIR